MCHSAGGNHRGSEQDPMALVGCLLWCVVKAQKYNTIRFRTLSQKTAMGTQGHPGSECTVIISLLPVPWAGNLRSVFI